MEESLKNKKEYSIETSLFPAGAYLVTVKSTIKSFVKKI